MNKEFQVHILNADGINKAKEIAILFDATLDTLLNLCPQGRELSVVRTKLEEACFFAKKAMATDPINQRQEI